MLFRSQLKSRLHKEGLFDPVKKQPLPAYPTTIALITSPAGAAVRDMIRILGARWPMSKVIVVPVRVQGAEAPEEICQALDLVNALILHNLLRWRIFLSGFLSCKECQVQA